eukprot:TRINITY_DN468_c0_g1_i1.p1 TRINITY_DN468_c0_g1~~TRINITY_DN468_c0_g1_i1.p1  ORF type:complete len:140 (-),score=48.41 TRINITY_DN468_c0_g1_i1:831-1217(-)
MALGSLLNNLKGGLDHDRLANISDTRAYDREAVTTNVRTQLEALSEDDGVMKRIEEGELLVVGGFYEISSGIVDFFGELQPPTTWGRQASEGVKGVIPAGAVKETVKETVKEKSGKAKKGKSGKAYNN